MALLRNEVNKSFTIISNYILQSTKVSLKAIGMYAKLASLPDNWKFTEAGLTAICRDGKDGVKTALNELEDLGLLLRFRQRNIGGTLGEAIYYISSAPMSEEEKKEIMSRYSPRESIVAETVDTSEVEPKAEKPTLEKPTLEKPTLENPQQLNTNILNTNLSNTNYIKNKVSKKESKKSFDELIENYTTNEELREELKNHLATRKTKKATLTNRAIELSFKKLDELVYNKPINEQEEEKIKIVQQSIERGWVGFFEIKENASKQYKKNDGWDYLNEEINRIRNSDKPF
jgi:hypothetical protein